MENNIDRKNLDKNVNDNSFQINKGNNRIIDIKKGRTHNIIEMRIILSKIKLKL